MSENWAERQRRTNKLARLVAAYLFKSKTVLPDQLHGLCKLTWITNSYSGDNPAYIKSTKIPALGSIFKIDFSDRSIEQVAGAISSILNLDVDELIISETGFTNFYKAYRNSSSDWIKDNITTLLPLFKEAFSLSNDDQGASLIKKLETLPLVPKANHKDQGMRPEYLLTPVFFALDSRIRFPLINGNEGVKSLLSKLNVTNAPLVEQYLRMISLYGTGGITDAADLDQIGRDLPDFIEISGKKPTKKILENKPASTESELPLKDESDLVTLQEARTITSKRIHNTLTNKIKSYLSNHLLLEGCEDSAMFDVLVKNYDGEKNDLLIEVKSSSESPHIRMAIGQVFDYWFRTKRDSDPHLAILIPNKPAAEIISLLEWLDIGVLWFSAGSLETCTEWLDVLVER